MQKIKGGQAFPLGVNQTICGVQFALHQEGAKECSLILYKQGSNLKEQEVVLNNLRSGNVFSVCFEDEKLENFRDYEYIYRVDGKLICDPYAKGIAGKETWGHGADHSDCRGIVYVDDFDWGEDMPPNLLYSDVYLYQLHVRGFTKHSSSKVLAKGCFKGVEEKLLYMKNLGVNAIFLLPSYEFEEREITQQEAAFTENTKPEETKINYWGYAEKAFHFSPKSSYAFDKKNPQREMKEMIKLFHKEKMEVWMDLFFPVGTNPTLILDCMRFWITDYHIDGFRVNNNVVPTDMISKDPLIGSIKLLTSYWNAETVNEKKIKKLAEYNDGFLADVRRFLKSDEGQIRNYIHRIRHNTKEMAVVNYITSINGFTLMDLVSYDIKHNEANGEQGNDGTDFNYSWNCGVEGRTRKKQILKLRRQQIRNAFLMLFLSQGTPMLLSGDEFGNSQDGNNNAYCQDNAISWLNWRQLETNEDIFLFVKELLAFRKEHPILHQEEALKGMDYKSIGCPDISFHGKKAWYVDDSNYSRLLGVMLNGEYCADSSYYFAFNMHWEVSDFDLPKLSRGKEWTLKMDTSFAGELKKELKSQKNYMVAGRSIVVFQSVICPIEKKLR